MDDVGLPGWARDGGTAPRSKVEDRHMQTPFDLMS